MKAEEPMDPSAENGPLNSEWSGSGASNDPNLPRKEREKARHRREVLRAAERLLSVKSYSEIGVHEIAEASEFSVGYLYRLFPSKEDLFASLIRIRHEELTRLTEHHVSKPGSAEERLRDLVFAAFDWLKQNPAYTASTVRELMLLSCTLPGLAAEFALWEARSTAMMRGLFEEGIREGLFGEGENPEIMARTLKALTKGFVQEDLFHGRDKAAWTEYTPIIMRILMRAFGPEGGHS